MDIFKIESIVKRYRPLVSVIMGGDLKEFDELTNSQVAALNVCWPYFFAGSSDILGNSAMDQFRHSNFKVRIPRDDTITTS